MTDTDTMARRLRYAITDPNACPLCGAPDAPLWKVADGRLYDRLCANCRNTVASNLETDPEGEAASYDLDVAVTRLQAMIHGGPMASRDAAEYVSAQRRAARSFAIQWELARGRVKDKIDVALAANLAHPHPSKETC